MLRLMLEMRRCPLLPAAVLLLAAGSAAAATRNTVAMAYIGPTGTPTYDGVRLGLHEDNLQGNFLNNSFSVDTVPPSRAGKFDASGYVAVLADLPADQLRSLAARLSGVPVLNLVNKDDALRSSCIPNLFDIIQSRAMETDAVAQWQKKHPGSQVQATGWDPRFVKYAGADLNKRYTDRYRKKMDETAWAGWVGARMIGDVINRGTTAAAGAVMQYLKTKLAFDGQKGLEMTFRKTGQLRQPVLLLENGKLLDEEAPVRGVVDPDDYDSLGSTGCSE